MPDNSVLLTAPKDAGSYKLVVSVADTNADYTGSVDIPFTISLRNLTVGPKSVSMTVGGTQPTFELAYTGLASGESITPDTTPTFTCTGDGSAIGDFTITWTNEGATTFTGDENYNVTKQATGTLTVAAQTVTVSFNANGGSGTMSAVPVTKGGSYTLPACAFTYSGYTFNGWKIGNAGDTLATGSSITVNNNITVYAQWSVTASYTVTFNGNSGSPATQTVMVTPPATTVALPTAPTRSGYTFTGWNTAANGSGTTFTAATTVTGDITVYAQWTSSGGGGGGGGGGTSTTSSDAKISNTKTDFNADKGGSVSLTLTPNGKTLTGLKNGSYTLKKGTDYTVSGNTVTISEAYLSSLPAGTHTIVLEMSGGTNPQLTVTVTGAKEQQPTAPAYQPMQPTHSAGTQVEAGKTNNALVVNGEVTELPAVKISGYNWLKLRDFAMLLNGTSKQLSISYDAATGVIDIRTGQAYQPQGNELTDTLAEMENAVASLQQIRVNGEFIDIAAYNINGYNYFRLRDLAIILDFAVTYDEASGQITLDFNNPYSE